MTPTTSHRISTADPATAVQTLVEVIAYRVHSAVT